MLHPEDLRSIAAAALTLYERRSNPAVVLSESEPRQLARRIARWREQAARHDDTTFARRLALDGLQQQDLPRLLGGAAWAPDAPLPEWACFLGDSLRLAAAWTREEIWAPAPAVEKAAFAPLVRPFVAQACQRLTARACGRSRLVSEEALASPRRQLIIDLSHLAAPTYHLEFTIFKSRRETGLARVFREATGRPSDRLYSEFVEAFYQGGWRHFLLTYPVLGRRLSMLSLNWAASLDELLSRLEADWERLQAEFSDLRGARHVQTIDIALSDRHRGGRTTAVLRFDSGYRLVYKPKPLQTDRVLEELTTWLNGKQQTLPLRVARTLDRGAYGWQDYISHEGCADQSAIERFYLRMGHLLALIYVVEGYDYHYENVIASGEHPYLIDSETLFNPYKALATRDGGRMDAAAMASAQVYYSVLRTGMLPGWSLGSRGTRRDTSALAGGDPAASDPIPSYRWSGLGTDDLVRVPSVEPVKTRGNLPSSSNGLPVAVDDHAWRIREGFRQLYQVVLTHRDEYIALARQWSPMRVRFVRKATRLYSDQLRRLTAPACMRDGIEWSLEVEAQSRMFLGAGAPAEAWPLLQAEYEALMQADIPYFTVDAGDLHVRNGSGDVIAPKYFTRSCVERLADKALMLNDRDALLQDRYIAYSFYAHASRTIHDDPAALDCLVSPHKQPSAHDTEATPSDCLSAATDIADELIAESLAAEDGSRWWIALEYLKETRAFQLKPISYNLYSGGMGVALFLAAVARVTQRAEYRAAALAALQPLLPVARDEPADVIRLSGLGAGVGLGSLIYGLASIAALLGDAAGSDRCRAMALRCLESITEHALQRDQQHDLVSGIAGALVAAAKLASLSADSQVEAAMIRMGRRLVAASTAAPGVVPTYQGRPITGMAHGAAGVAVALIRLYECTGERVWLDAAMRHVDFEEGLYVERECNYPDYRSRPGQPAFMSAWCHGAPGIGLSRLLIHRITGDGNLLPQIRRGIAAAAQFTLGHLDHLCCGSFGRLDIQWSYARYFRDEPATHSVRRDVGHLLARYRETGGFRLFVNAPIKVFSPGLFVGASGIGYTLLRLASSDALPSVLAFE